MPAPSNIDFASAINIGVTLPYSTTQDVRDSGNNYTVYYKYIEQAGDNELGLFAFGALSPGYQVICNIYTGPAASPTPYLSITGTNVPLQFPATGTPGTEFFFEFISLTGSVPDPAVLNLEVYRFTDTTPQLGDIVINDDSDGFPVAILNGTTGVVRKFVRGFASGEYGQILPNGISIFENVADNTIKLYDVSFNEIASFTCPFTDNGKRIFTSNKVDKFYFAAPGSGGLHAEIGTVSDAGVVGGTTWTLPAAGIVAMCVDPTETILYNVGQTSSTNAPIKQWNLGTNTMGADLVAAPSVTAVVGKDLLYLDDDTILVIYKDGSDIKVYRYDTLGVLQNSYDLDSQGATGADTRITHAIDDPNSFWAWIKTSGGISKFLNIKVSDGSILASFTAVQFETGAYQGAQTATPSADWGHSESCPFVIARASSTATLTVIKATNPSGDAQSFNFTTTGGLSPATFSLNDGDSQIFTGLAAGTYGVSETPVTGWEDPIYSVSNGDDHTTISLIGGDSVTIVVTNNKIGPNIGSGIYKVVPGKRNDTIYTDASQEQTVDVKIPDPFIKLAYLGE